MSIAEEWIACRAALGAHASWERIARAFRACKTFAQNRHAATAFTMVAKLRRIADPYAPLVAQRERRVSWPKIVQVKNVKVPREIQYAERLHVLTAFGTVTKRVTIAAVLARPNAPHCTRAALTEIVAAGYAIR